MPSLFELRCPSSASHTFRPRLGLIPMVLPVLRPPGLNWKYTTGFLGLPAYRWQTVELLNIHNHVSQSLIINLSLYTHTHTHTHTHIHIYTHTVVLFLLRALTNKHTHTLWTAQVCSDLRILSCARLRMLLP